MNKIGKFGEEIACVFLKKHGFKIVERNHSRKWGELDIVAKKAKKLCFVEVKTVSDTSVTHGTGESTTYRPEENMHPRKVKKFTRTIQTYLQEQGSANVDWSAALVAVRVDPSKKKAKVRFIENLVLQ